ncbi:hypothetical protein TNCV_414391 [Trichonephila clavipes]|nr:hypothetical protein TNCV_4548971 [Trichonephila clavipes]GFW41030.1 hypothetical protein TNCV_414391 [Trichonephila clavipes]
MAKAGNSLGSLQVSRDRAHRGLGFLWLFKTLRFLGHGSIFVNACEDDAVSSYEGQETSSVVDSAPCLSFGRLSLPGIPT